MNTGFVAILAGALLAAPPALADAPRTIPIYMSDGGHIMTDLMVNDAGPYSFILDTAAGMTVVFDDFAQEAGLEDVPGSTAIEVQGAGGAVTARLVDVGQVGAGDWHFTLDRAVSMPTVSHMGDVDGVLGANLLFQQPVGFSLGEGELHLYEAGVPISNELTVEADGWTAVTIERRLAQMPFFWLTVEVDGVAMDAVIDTGARRSAINPAGARALGIDPDRANLTLDEPIRGATENAIPAWVLPVTTVQVGERVWGDRRLTLSDLPIFERMGLSDTPTIVFGADFLAEQDFIIDPVDRVLWVRQRRSASFGFLRPPPVELGAAVH